MTLFSWVFKGKSVGSVNGSEGSFEEFVNLERFIGPLQNQKDMDHTDTNVTNLNIIGPRKVTTRSFHHETNTNSTCK